MVGPIGLLTCPDQEFLLPDRDFRNRFPTSDLDIPGGTFLNENIRDVGGLP